ncbi:response regulator [Actinokineospora auranticolor]|uniref:Circadian input-output histidine kinase CikA n=1 Tax=Actinokineospora auranticolor TaxID=155976 RepID=A0A2S6GLM9_9PSEU|nr:response regulator [Actinokineospora auranticolor]PPK66138.1 PAS domain S-box-containing protein [Actinokineospora auranticolor]
MESGRSSAHGHQARVVTFATASLTAVGVAALVGYAVDSRVLASLVPGGATVDLMTAICLVLLAIALRLVVPTGGSPARRWAGQAIAAAVAVTGIVAFMTTVGDHPSPADAVPFDEQIRAWAVGTGTPTAVAAAAVALAACGVIALDVDTVLSTAAAVVAVVAVVAGGHGPGNSRAMALPAGVGVVAVWVAVLAARSDRPSVRNLAGPNGTAAGRLASAVAAVVLLAGPPLAAVGVVDAAISAAALLVVVLAAVLALANERARPSAESIALEGEQRFHRLVLGAPDAMVIVDERGLITLVNQQTERLFRYRADELVGKPVEVLIPEQFRRDHVRNRHEYLTSPSHRGMGVGLELVGQRRDGSQFPVEISLAPLETDQGVLVSAAIRDTSERREAEQALAAARDEALAAVRVKSQFVAMVSHEIRTPMNGVIGLTELLLDTPLDASQQRYAQSIRASGRALLTIINDILDFSKVEAGKVELVETEFAMDQVLGEVVHAAVEAARDKDIEVVGHYPPELPIGLRGDAGRLRQVLLNLLGNAVKFTERGSVVLRAEPQGVTEDGGVRICFAVEDTGIGIAAADLPSLYEPFSQVEAAANRRYGGTGLGLAITRQLVGLMGGELEVTTEPGRGSRFSFALPFGRAPEADAPASRHLSGRRLLLLDDNPTTRDLITRHSRAWGMVATSDADLTTTLDRLRTAEAQEPFDLVVINQHVADRGGLDLVSAIAADADLAHIDTVLLTSGSYQDDQRAIAAGASAVLPKPINPAQLHTCLVGLLAPAEGPATGSTPLPVQRGRAEGGGETILLAEDNEINQMVAVGILTRFGYQVDVADNGLEVLRMVGTKPYAAILMDCQMPEMDGLTATVELRSRGGAGEIPPIIAMTAGALAEDRQACLDAGMDDYVTKPVDPVVLRNTLEKWIQRSRNPVGGRGIGKP